MASLVAALLQRMGAELQTRLYSPEDEAVVHEELPEPMLEVRAAVNCAVSALTLMLTLMRTLILILFPSLMLTLTLAP
jgi:hypothetical protein